MKPKSLIEAQRNALAKQVWQMREALSEAANEVGHLECSEEGCFCGDGWNHPAQATKKLIDSAIRAAKSKGGAV